MSASALLAAGGIAFAQNDHRDEADRPGDRQNIECFYPREVNGFRSAGHDQVYVEVGANRVYLFQTFGACPDLDFSQRLALRTAVPGTICNGIDVDLIVPGFAGPPQRCPIRMIRQLSRDEVYALNHRHH